MQGLKKDSRRLATVRGIRPDANPNAVEGTCPLCGRFMPLDKAGHCGTYECREQAYDQLRTIADGKTQVEGVYYRFGELEVMMTASAKQWKEPTVPPEYMPLEDDLLVCTHSKCQELARPGDDLCVQHRLEQNALEYKLKRVATRQLYEASGNRRRRKRRERPLGNRIKGLDKVKL